MRTDFFHFELPADRIALRPVEPRDAARLLVVGDGPDGDPRLEDRRIGDLPDLLRPGDTLVVNDTRVIRAALAGLRWRNGSRARIAVMLVRRVDESRWRALARPAKRLQAGDRIIFGGPAGGSGTAVCLLGRLTATVIARGEAGEVDLAFDFSGPILDEMIEAVGQVPLPPYIAQRRPAEAGDAASYQTLFAAREGAVAAPTAGLHFTPRLMERLAARGIGLASVTLHVGAGTFLPVKTEVATDHRMHAEWMEVAPETVAALSATRRRGGRIVAVGSTALRAIESASDETGTIAPFRGETSIFITPGYRFRAVDVLVTNFHLPRSTLFMLVAAFSGLDAMHRAYAHAIAAGYRFYSYGDACLLTRSHFKTHRPD